MVTPRQIKSTRNTLKMTQEQFAIALGVARKTISLWETGRSKPHPMFVEKMKELG